MVTTLAFCCLVGAAIPDTSTAYFPRLTRPHAKRVDVDAEKGPIILIVVDAMRPDRISPYGSLRDTTPNLNALADDGLVLTNFFVNGNWTRPSTATLLTGLPPFVHGVEADTDQLAEDFVTMAEVIGAAKIPTGAVVGNGNAGSAFGLGRGFDFYADTVKHWRGLPSADQVVELAIPFVRQNRDGRFFLMLFFVDPHDPYHAPEPYENMYVEDPNVRLIRTPHWELGRYSEAEIGRMLATYDGALRYTDAALGRFFDALKKMGVWDKATVMVTADHGEAFGEHGVYLHSHHFYDEIVRVPFIIKAPGMSQRGAYNHYLFQTIDLLPTVAGFFNLPAGADLPGVDIVRHLRRPRLNDPRRTVISEFHNFGIKRSMIRDYRRKIILQEPADRDRFMATVGKRSLLPSVDFDHETITAFDLINDPMEKRDLAKQNLLEKPAWRRLYRILKNRRSTVPKHRPAPMVKNLDPETYEDLKALGYIQ